MTQQTLIEACFRMLRPMARILLRQGLTSEAFEEIVRRVYVDVAEKDFALPGKKQSTSRIGVLTGLNRKEVARQLKLPVARPNTGVAPHNRAERVLSAWVRDDDFHDEKGDPASLPFLGEKSFSELVRRYSGDMPARAIADELIRIGVLREEQDKRLTLLSRAYVPGGASEEMLGYLGTHVQDLLNTFDHNMTRPRREARFQRQVIYDDVPARYVEDFRSVSARWSQQTLEELDRWLAEKKATREEGEPTVRLGLGIYEVETWSTESSAGIEHRDGDVQ
ncbi:MAG: DUF6502 family protein [Pseudomonadales bacterium]